MSFRKVRDALAAGYHGPLLLLDLDLVRAKARRFQGAMPRVRPHYAVKANPHPAVLRALRDEGVAFEIASAGELDLLMDLCVPAREVFYSNPVRCREHLSHAVRCGVEWFVVDSVDELRKVAAVKSDAKLCLRVDVPNTDSEWPLAGKFGATPDVVREVVAAAVCLGADLAGVSFHVGSQCLNPESWRLGIERAQATLLEMRLAGLRPRLLDIGGGFPVRYARPVPSIEAIGAIVHRALADVPLDVTVIAEPGRYLVADAACFVCRVIGTATRKGRRWMYWDAGIFGGIIETARGMVYEIRTDRRGALVPWTIAGPTCDAADVLKGEHLLPEDMQEGDFVYLPNTGAYTNSRACTFNGFPLPEVRVIGAET
ncbi:MAG: type III PLP-dependent enzyme [Burkholderiales bacterium]|nr:type III PLP-dependent enzyme [Burkholderiales bacterium]